MVLDEDRIEDKIDKIFDEIKEIVKAQAVQEQKLREINHRMGDGQQRNVLSHEMLRNEMTEIANRLNNKVDIEDYRETLRELKDTLAKDRKMIITISIILVTGSGVVANMEPVKKLLMHLLGLN